MKALVLNEIIVQVVQTDFEVAPPLFWVDCPDDCNTDDYAYDPQIKEIYKKPELPPTEEQYIAAMFVVMGKVANEKGYDSMASIVTYVASTNAQWKAEAQAFVNYRDKCWEYAYEVLAKVEAGEPAPSIEDFVKEMPQITWP